jgi:hypothetical protein
MMKAHSINGFALSCEELSNAIALILFVRVMYLIQGSKQPKS